jgi:hypothetical protein
LNVGLEATPLCYHGIYVDDISHLFIGPSVIPGGSSELYMNFPAASPVKGGRHTVLSRADVFDNVLENIENNNDWARQYIWSGLELSPNAPVTRTADPYIFTIGWGPYGNNEGFQAQVQGPSYWDIFAVLAENESTEFDISLCTEAPLNVPQQGFGAAVASSNYAGQYIDFVIIDRNVAPSGTYYASVYNWGGTANKLVEFDRDKGVLANPGESNPYTLSAGELVNMHEVYLVGGQPTRIQIRRFGGDAKIYLGLFNPSSGYADKFWAEENSSTAGLGPGNDIFVDITASSSDFYGIVVAKQEVESLGKALQYSVVVSQQLNLTRHADYLWYGPIVPRSAPDADFYDVQLSPVLNGNQPSTWLNFGSINQGPGTAPNFWTRALFDDVPLVDGFFVGDCPEGSAVIWNNSPQGAPGFSLPGGLHHLRTSTDVFNQVAEFPEYDNDFTDWFVWSPLELANHVPVQRPAPPVRFPLGGGPYESCDGLRKAGDFTSYWTAIGMIPTNMANDYDVRLHLPSAGSKDGFGSALAWSADVWPGNPDFCIINYNAAPFIPTFDASVTNWSGPSNDYFVQRADAPYMGNVHGGLYRLGPFNLGASKCLDIYEFYFEPGIPYFISINNIGGNADLELYLFDGAGAYHTKQTSITWSNSTGQGGDEHLAPVTFDSPGFHAIVVSKSKAFDAGNSATYELVFSSGQSVVDAPVSTLGPSTFALSAPRPNPFAGKATIELAVPQGQGKAAVGIFDLQGRRIAELANEATPGRHTLTWDGRDTAGREVAAGVYFVRLDAAGVQETKKITLLR